MGRGRLD